MSDRGLTSYSTEFLSYDNGASDLQKPGKLTHPNHYIGMGQLVVALPPECRTQSEKANIFEGPEQVMWKSNYIVL